MDRADLERDILEAVRESLEHDAGFNADFGKRVTGVRLEGHHPNTTLVLDVEERRPPLTLLWSPRYAIWDGSWEQGGSSDPSPDGVAVLLSTDLMESSGAFIDCVARPELDDAKRTRALLAVRDFQGCIEFYRDGLSFCSSLRSLEPDPPKAELELGRALLTLEAFDARARIDEPPQRLYNAAMFLRVRSIEESLGPLQRWEPRVGRREMLDQQYIRVLHVEDPDGNLIEICDDEPPAPP